VFKRNGQGHCEYIIDGERGPPDAIDARVCGKIVAYIRSLASYCTNESLWKAC